LGYKIHEFIDAGTNGTWKVQKNMLCLHLPLFKWPVNIFNLAEIASKEMMLTGVMTMHVVKGLPY
jgi:hypothetical protein